MAPSKAIVSIRGFERLGWIAVQFDQDGVKALSLLWGQAIKKLAKVVGVIRVPGHGLGSSGRGYGDAAAAQIGRGSGPGDESQPLQFDEDLAHGGGLDRIQPQELLLVDGVPAIDVGQDSGLGVIFADPGPVEEAFQEMELPEDLHV